MKEFITKRLEKAGRSIKAAERDLGDQDSESATSHGYYAMFYVAEALLFQKGLRFGSHGGVHSAFGQHFAKTKELDPKFHKGLLKAFDKRVASDYGVDPGELDEDAQSILQQAKEFLQTAQDYLSKKN